MKKLLFPLFIVLLTACSKTEDTQNINEPTTDVNTQKKSEGSSESDFSGYWKNKGTPDIKNKEMIELREINGGFDMTNPLTGEFIRNLKQEGGTLVTTGENPVVYSLRENNSELKIGFASYERITADQFKQLKEEKEAHDSKCKKYKMGYLEELHSLPPVDVEFMRTEEDKKKMADIKAKYTEIQKANPDCNIGVQ